MAHCTLLIMKGLLLDLRVGLADDLDFRRHRASVLQALAA